MAAIRGSQDTRCRTLEVWILSRRLRNSQHCPYIDDRVRSTQCFEHRTYEDRLETISNVREAGISVCCGGILGLGEVRKTAMQFGSGLIVADPQLFTKCDAFP